MTAQIVADDLVATLSLETYMALFDDLNTGSRTTVDASPGVVSCLARAEAEVASWMENLYPGANIPASTSALLRHAKILFASIVAYRRHPEYVKTYNAEPGGQLMTEYIELMKRVQMSTQRIPAIDGPPAAPPPNVGGTVRSGDPDSPTPPRPKFLDGTGDF